MRRALPVTLPLASLAVVAILYLLVGRNREVPEQWFKGNTHTHSLWSDGNDFPEMIARFYRENGYHFLVLTDHNVLSRGEKWMSVKEVEKRRRIPTHSTLEKYVTSFGQEWVELRGKDDQQEVRLKTLEEIRPKFEQPGGFLFIEGEEISASFNSKHIHINALNLDEVIEPKEGDSVRETMRNNLIAVKEQAERLQRPILAHVNHPNFHWSVTAEDIAHVLEEDFFEVYNGHPVINHLGDADRPGDQQIWDIANTIRLSELGARPLFGVATDDSHTYHGGDVMPGRGWIMVNAESLGAEVLLEAMRAGDFYASTGVTLRQVIRDQKKGELRFEIVPDEGVRYTTQIIGTRRGAEHDPSKIGEVLATFEGHSIRYQLSDEHWYIRATVNSDRPHPKASYKDQLEQAWVQPIWNPATTSKP
ncbi:MAG: PHP domain-containing protein [Haloferula sp.]